MDDRRKLKIKIKALMAEARIIRSEEHRLKGARRRLRDPAFASTITPDTASGIIQVGRSLLSELQDLQFHRRVDLRRIARNSLAAYAIIRGKKFSDTFPKAILKEWLDSDSLIAISGMLVRFAREDQANAIAKATAWILASTQPDTTTSSSPPQSTGLQAT